MVVSTSTWEERVQHFVRPERRHRRLIGRRNPFRDDFRFLRLLVRKTPSEDHRRIQDEPAQHRLSIGVAILIELGFAALFTQYFLGKLLERQPDFPSWFSGPACTSGVNSSFIVMVRSPLVIFAKSSVCNQRCIAIAVEQQPAALTVLRWIHRAKLLRSRREIQRSQDLNHQHG